jgi:hypothetical protein
VPISSKEPLSLVRVARLWSKELGGDASERASLERNTPTEIFITLVLAFEEGELDAKARWRRPDLSQLRDALKRLTFWYSFDLTRPFPEFPETAVLETPDCDRCDFPDRCSDESHREVDRLFPSTRPFCRNRSILTGVEDLEVTRDEFMRWIDRSGYTQPKFWPAPQLTQAPTPLQCGPPGQVETSSVKKNPRGRAPVKTKEAIAKLRAALAADPTLRDKPPTQEALRALAGGGVSREIAVKAWAKVLNE